MRVVSGRVFFEQSKTLLGKIEGPDDYDEEYGTREQYETRDKHGNIYKIKSPVWSPKIIKISPSGEKTVIVSDPFYLWIIKSPLPSLAIVIMLAILYSAWDWMRKRKYKGETNNSDVISDSAK